jgi:hypothetical protein
LLSGRVFNRALLRPTQPGTEVPTLHLRVHNMFPPDGIAAEVSFFVSREVESPGLKVVEL